MSVFFACVALAFGGAGGCPRGGPALAPPRGGQAVPETYEQLALRLAFAHGYDARNVNCLDVLWNRESGFQLIDQNGASGAAGIPQALPPSKMGPQWWLHPVQQIEWGFGYIDGRYDGSPCVALAHSDAYNWY